MRYSEHYTRLIAKAQQRSLSGYSENHHIVPRCLGGSDDTDNKVKLTAEEHYVAHQLLVKIHPEEVKLAYAANMMTVDINGNRVHNKAYRWLKLRCSEASRLYRHSEDIKVKLSQSKLGTKLSKATKDKLSKAQKGRQTSQHTRDIISAKVKESYTDARKLAVSELHRNKVVSQETRNKLSAALSGKPQSDVCKSALIKAITGRVPTQAHREKASKSWTTEMRDKQSERMKLRHQELSKSNPNYGGKML